MNTVLVALLVVTIALLLINSKAMGKSLAPAGAGGQARPHG